MTIMFLIILLITVVVLNSCQKSRSGQLAVKQVDYIDSGVPPQMKLVCATPNGYIYVYFHQGRNIYVYENLFSTRTGSISVH